MSAQALARLEALMQTITDMTSRFRQLEQQIAGTAAKQPQTPADARQIVQELWTLSEQANDLDDQASDIDTEISNLADEVASYVDNLRSALDEANGVVWTHAAELASTADYAADTLQEWADDFDQNLQGATY